MYEGEQALTKENHKLGELILTSITPAPKGVTKIEVTFEIDINGILTVTIEEKGTGEEVLLIGY